MYTNKVHTVTAHTKFCKGNYYQYEMWYWLFCWKHSCLCHYFLPVALLEFTQQLYNVQENLGPLTVNIRLASISPILASSLGPNPIQVHISSDGTGSAAGGELSDEKRQLKLTVHKHNTRFTSLFLFFFSQHHQMLVLTTTLYRLWWASMLGMVL